MVLAAGATHSYFCNDKWEQFAPGLKTVEDALEIRRRVLLAFELAGTHDPLNFIVIGGGPTGVELAVSGGIIAKRGAAAAKHGCGDSYSTQVLDVCADQIVTKEATIKAAAIIWAAGVRASPLGKLLGVDTDRGGHENVFVCGDLAHAEEDGKQLPGVAPCAMQMGDHAALEIAADLSGKPRTRFHCFDKGDKATIGRRRAACG